MNSFEKPSDEILSGENEDQKGASEALEKHPSDITKETPEDATDTPAKEERQQADAAKLAELKEDILGASPDVKKEGNKKESGGIEIDPSLKRKGTDFTDSLATVHRRLHAIEEESANVVSPGTLGRFRSATRNLEETFSGSKLNLDETSASLNRLTATFEDLSLINDRELRKITEDAKRSLISAIASSKDSAMSLRAAESMAQLSRNINELINKADEAAFRLRRSLG